jgi:hypothetical protein
MYHAMRAASYVHHGGDDHQQHSELPQHTPVDFPNAAAWTNRLKVARAKRNEADYEPYPKSGAAWRPHAQAVAADATALLIETRAYLLRKGCTL